MEKPGKHGRPFKHTGLLTILFFTLLIPSLTAAPIISENSQSGSVPAFYTSYEFTTLTEGNEWTYNIYIPEIRPADIDYIPPGLPDGVYLVSEKKELRAIKDIQIPAGTYTVIELTFLFTAEGSIQPGNLSLVADDTRIILQLPVVDVLPAEKKLITEVSWDIAESETSTFVTGTTYMVKLMGENISGIEKTTFTLPEDALFEETENPNQQTVRNVSADFLWTPLYAGTSNLPEITVTVTDYYNQTVTIRVPPLPLTVKAATGTQPFDFTGGMGNISGTFAQAFSTEKQEHRDTDKTEIISSISGIFTEKKLKEYPRLLPAADAWAEDDVFTALAILRGIEKISLLSSEYTNVRIAVEQTLELTNTRGVLSVYTYLIPMAAALILLLAALILLYKKRWTAGLILAILCVLCAVFSVCLNTMAKQQWAVYTGGTINSVPEQTSSAAGTLKAGTPVKLRKKAGNWYYIQFNERSTGWTEESKLILY